MITKRVAAAGFREAIVCGHISVSLHQPEEVQKLVERSHAEEFSWNAQTVLKAESACWQMTFFIIVCRRASPWKNRLALGRSANQHPENPVGQFCYWHFSRIARVLRTQRPLYARDLMADKHRLPPLLPALKNYMSLKSPALRNAGRISVMMSIASLMGSALHLPKPYWILMTGICLSPNGWRDARAVFCTVRSGTLVGW